MIPPAIITAWGRTRPWPTREQVEQDLLLARAMVEIYNHPVLRNELVFRGGTCLHQVHLPNPLRYSEDLDYVRRTHSPIGPTLDALREVASSIGLATRSTQVGKYPRIKLQAAATGSDRPLRIKLEINTYETSPARPAIQVPFAVDTGWFRGGCKLTTFVPAELVATKLRALYQRSKGRDVFDLWLALEQLRLEPADILECFAPYRPANYSAAAAIANLRGKLSSPSFRHDTDLLVTETPAGYDIDTAAERIIDQLLSRVAESQTPQT